MVRGQREHNPLFSITDYQAVDRIIDHLKLTFTAAKPPPARIGSQELLIAAEARAEYSS